MCKSLPSPTPAIGPPACNHRRQQREAISAGWQPHGNRDPDYGHTYERTGTSTWCSFNWARPAKCQHDAKPAMMPDEIWHQSLPSGMPGHPVRSVFNNKIEFIHNYKAASSAVAAFLSCAYGREVDSSVFEASVFVVRDPIDRFVSAVGEMLRRYVRSSTPRPCSADSCLSHAPLPSAQVNDHCPPGPNGPVLCSHSTMRPAFTDMFSDEMDFKGRRKETLEEAMKSTRWWPLARSKGVGADVLAELLTAFVDDIQCCHSSYSMDHFSAQSVFAATYATRGIDVVIKMSNLEAGLQQLTQRVQSSAPPGQCELSSQINSAATNKGSVAAGDNLPSSDALRAALTGDHIRELCKIYAQDYTCFDLPLPTECPPRVMSGMAPLPPAPPNPPPPRTAMHMPPSLSPTFNMPPLPPLLEESITGGDYYQPPPPPPLITSPYPFLAGLNPFHGQESLARAGSVATIVLLIVGLLGRFFLRVVRERREAALKGLAAKRVFSTSKRRRSKAASTRGTECTAIQVVISDDDVYSGRVARGQKPRSSRSGQSRSKPRRAYSAVGVSRGSRELLPSYASEDDGYDSVTMSAEDIDHSRKQRHERSAAPAGRGNGMRQAASNRRASPPRRSKAGFPERDINGHADFSDSEEED